jgi:hypothetical protein
MIQDHQIGMTKWLEVLLYFRGEKHQTEAALLLYQAIEQVDPCLLHENAEWFRLFTTRDKLVHSFMHPEGE